MIELTDAELQLRLTDTEDNFVERKSKGDKGGWLRTTVAFANSTPIGYPAVLFLGVSDRGEIAENVGLENMQKSYSGFVKEYAWPPIYYAARILTHSGRSCVAVIVPGSENRPHFAGRAYVRLGTQNVDASDEQFKALIAQRSSKVYEISKHKGKLIDLEQRQLEAGGQLLSLSTTVFLVDCNQFFLTYASTTGDDPVSLPLNDVDVSFHHNKGLLSLVRCTWR